MTTKLNGIKIGKEIAKNRGEEYLNDNNINYRWQHKTFIMPNGRT